MARTDGRANDEMRPVKITLGYQDYPEGSALIEIGKTRVICAVSVEERVPPFLKGQGSGWVTAEYAMLPRATHTRTSRSPDRQQGRSQEIQRLIGRSLRSAVDMDSLGERTFTIDCDVLQADGGTRTASITGAYVALFVAYSPAEKAGDLQGHAVQMRRGRHQRGRGGQGEAARPLLRRGLPRRGGFQRGDDG